MAVKDWVCSVCSAQNRNTDSVCRVCDTARKQTGAAVTPPETEKRKKPPRERGRTTSPRKADETLRRTTPARRSSAVRVMNIVWYVVLALTAVQWTLNFTLPEIFRKPQDCFVFIQRFAPAGYASALGEGVAALAENISAAQQLPGLPVLWRYGLSILGTADTAPLAAQCAVLTAVWLVRLIVLALAETRGVGGRRQRNLSYFTIIPIDLLLTALAMVPRMSALAAYIKRQLVTLLPLQLLAISAALVMFLLIGAFSRRRMTRCVIKGGVSAALIYLCAALIYTA